MNAHTLSAAAAQLRPSALARGRGQLQLIKPQPPAAGSPYLYTIPGDYWVRLLSISATLVNSGTAANRQMQFNAVDGDGFIFNQTIAADALPAAVTVTVYGDLSQTTPVSEQTGTSAEGSVTTPTANQAICTVTGANRSQGPYLAWVYLTISGTPAQGTDNNNVKLVNNGAAFAVLDNNIGTATQPFGPFELDNVGGNIVVEAIGAGTAGAVYSATLYVQPVGTQNNVQIPDFLMKSGWGWQVGVLNQQAGDQLSGLSLLIERYPSSDIYLKGNDALELIAELAATALGV